MTITSILLKNWQELTDQYCEPDDSSKCERLFEKLIYHYSTSRRVFHTLSFIQYQLQLAFKYQKLLLDYEVVCFGIWFKHAMYDPLSNNYQERSAIFAEAQLQKIHVPDDKIVQVMDLILKSDLGQSRVTDTTDKRMFMDFYNTIFGLQRAVYLNQMEQIRKEFKFVPDIQYIPNRRKQLESLLNSDTIFQSLAFQKLYELKARRNILFELKLLQVKK